jgi:hypothetical protein
MDLQGQTLTDEQIAQLNLNTEYECRLRMVENSFDFKIDKKIRKPVKGKTLNCTFNKVEIHLESVTSLLNKLNLPYTSERIKCKNDYTCITFEINKGLHIYRTQFKVFDDGEYFFESWHILLRYPHPLHTILLFDTITSVELYLTHRINEENI